MAAIAVGVAAPSKRTKVGKLKALPSENLAMASDACAASEPLGRKLELLFS